MSPDSTKKTSRRVVRARSLTSARADGKRYKRSATIEAEIRNMLSLPQSEWIAKANGLQNETLVFLIRQTHGSADEHCGRLLEKLRARIQERVRRLVRRLDEVSAEEILMSVEIEILEGVLTKQSSRKTDFLEVAFARAVRSLTIDAIRKLNNSPMGNRGEFTEASTDEHTEEIERPIELVPDERLSPEDLMLHLDDDNHRHQMLKKAIAAVKNPVHLEAIRLHYGQGWPIQSTSRRRPSLTRVFRASPRKIRYGIEIGLEQMRAAIGIKVRRRS